MSPSNALKDRIKQFEALDGAAGLSRPPKAFSKDRPNPRPGYPPTLTRTPSTSTSSTYSNLLEDPISPTASSYTIIKPTVPYVPRKPRVKSPSPSPPNLDCNTSLIDLKEWIVEDSPKSAGQSFRNDANGFVPPRFVPPLPPRIATQNSGASSSVSSRSSLNATLSTQSYGSSNSLTVDHTYPPSSKTFANSNSRQRQGHVPASSTSSFHSVSLSSDGDATADCASTDRSSIHSANIATYPMDRPDSVTDIEGEKDRESVDDSFSFENVSSNGMSSPTLSATNEWEKDFATPSMRIEPPKHPARRPVFNKSNSSPIQPASSYSSQGPSPIPNPLRRIPPPPPIRKSPPSESHRASLMSTISTTTSVSDRSSILSAGTVTTAHTSISSYNQLLRPTPVPPVARKRYEAVFFANINAQRRAILNKPPTLAAPQTPATASPSTPKRGWRGISVDLITNPEENPALLDDGIEGSMLDGIVVRHIWSKSRLSKEKLKDIWSVCALPGQSSLDKEGFVKGMWKIDEELKRSQSLQNSAATLIGFRSRPQKRWTKDSLLH